MDHSKYLKKARTNLRLWEDELENNKYGMKKYAERAIKVLKAEIDHVTKLEKPWLKD